MNRLSRPAALAPLFALFLSVTGIAAGVELESITVGFTEAWTGNGYVPTPDDPGGVYDFQVTGSEAMPIDPFLVAGVRLTLVDGLLAERNLLSLTPTLQLGVRRYLLYSNGWVVPTQKETALGDDEDNEPGLGSARVVTMRVSSPVSYEVGFANGSALVIGISPTLVFRIRAGDLEVQSAPSDLAPMYSFFYGSLRFLMPEAHLAYRFRLSDFLKASVFADYGVSILDLFGPESILPAYDQMRAQVGIRLELVPPFSGLFRDTEPQVDLPRLDENAPEADTPAGSD